MTTALCTQLTCRHRHNVGPMMAAGGKIHQPEGGSRYWSMMACRPNANQTGLRPVSEPTKMPTAVRCQFTDRMPVTSDIGPRAG